MSGVLSFCESVTATGHSPWHLRWLDGAGPKFGGGVTTPSLCGRVRARYGWDLEVAITPRLIEIACGQCLAVLAERASQDEAEHACACGTTEAELNAKGRQLYVCDACHEYCCSEHSENGPGITVYCDDCAEGSSP